MVSFFNLSKLVKSRDFTGDFETYVDLFIHDKVINTPYFPHLKQGWAQKNNPNMFFLFYEDLVHVRAHING